MDSRYDAELEELIREQVTERADHADYDFAFDAEAEAIEEAIRQQSEDGVRAYLGKYGDAAEARVDGCTETARQLLGAGQAAAALVFAASAVELAVRFLILRPLVHGAFLDDEWAELLTARAVGGRSAEDRMLVPQVLRHWGVAVDADKSRLVRLSVA
jgi:hypothetical protein